jgi:hypothetical protein
MTYQPSEAEALVDTLMEEVASVIGKKFADQLSDAYTTVITEYEERAVAQHGRLILAAIEGTTWAAEGSRSTTSENASRLVRLVAP